VKSITARILAITLLGLWAAPFAHAQTASGVEEMLKSMEDSWAAAQLQKDHGAIVVDGLLSADFFGINSKGKLQNKAEWLEHARTDSDTCTYSKNDSMDVHLYGPNIATVCGTSTEKGKDKDGKKFSRSYAWVDTWMERNGQWQCIAEGEVTPMVKK
jgi:ketosteroid isomerase-like protein